MPLIKSVGAANRQSPTIPRKFVALFHRNTKIRLRSDECDKLNFTATDRLIFGCFTPIGNPTETFSVFINVLGTPTNHNGIGDKKVLKRQLCTFVTLLLHSFAITAPIRFMWDIKSTMSTNFFLSDS